MSTAWRTQPPAGGPVKPFAFPKVTRRTLDNGLTLLHARHGGVPVVAIRCVVMAGASAEPVERAGLARLAASSLDTGTALHDGPALAWALERQGVELTIEAGWDAITLEATVPAQRVGPTLELVAEIARFASFEDAEVQRVRAEQLAAILQRTADPRSLADDSTLRFVFAEDTRYSRPVIGAADTVASIDRDTVLGFRDALFAPRNVALIIVGDLDANDAQAVADTHFGDWRHTGANPPVPRLEPRSESSCIHVVHRTDAVQSELRFAHPCVSRNHPDYVALLVMNSVLGGMFTSRLNLNLRERHGFTYGVRSQFAFRRNGGVFLISTAVATDVTAAAATEVLAELRRMHAHGATPDEVAAARDYLAGVMPLELQTAADVADGLTQLFVHGLPDDWHQRHRDALTAVPVEEVARVAREHLRPDALTLIVAGDADPISPGLQALDNGPVQRHPTP